MVDLGKLEGYDVLCIFFDGLLHQKLSCSRARGRGLSAWVGGELR